MAEVPFPALLGDGLDSRRSRHNNVQGVLVGYLAGLLAIAVVVFGWSLVWGLPVIGALLIADFLIET